MDILKLVGAFGLLLISAGIVTRDRRRQDVIYIVGGIGLEAYSIHIGDPIFIVLQIVFTAAAAVDLYKVSVRRKAAGA